MGGDASTIDRRAAKAMLQWWVESGVDVAVADTPRRWLGAPRPRADPGLSVSPETAIEGPPATLPEGFAEFRAWLETGSGLPLDRPGARRILPQGAVAAEIMILTDSGSEEEDRPLGGDAWHLTVRMLAAIGLTPEQAYIAPLSCFAAPGARLNGDDLARCADIARRHVTLVAPKRLLLFGDGPSRAVTGEPVARARGRVHSVEGVRSVATFHPRMLLMQPSQKSQAWRDLLLLMDEDR